VTERDPVLVEAAPIVGYWSRTFIGWIAYHEDIPLIRHDLTGWEPIEDQAAAKAVRLAKGRQAPRPRWWARGAGGSDAGGRDSSASQS
jgi:hypothetical protein